MVKLTVIMVTVIVSVASMKHFKQETPIGVKILDKFLHETEILEAKANIWPLISWMMSVFCSNIYRFK